MAGYFCNQDISGLSFEYWRYSGTTSYQIMFKGMQDAENQMNIGVGADVFSNKILLLAGACNELIGPEFQKQQMQLFHDVELVVIPDAGHFMFSEKPEHCTAVIRSYFNN